MVADAPPAANARARAALAVVAGLADRALVGQAAPPARPPSRGSTRTTRQAVGPCSRAPSRWQPRSGRASRLLGRRRRAASLQRAPWPRSRSRSRAELRGSSSTRATTNGLPEASCRTPVPSGPRRPRAPADARLAARRRAAARGRAAREARGPAIPRRPPGPLRGPTRGESRVAAAASPRPRADPVCTELPATVLAPIASRAGPGRASACCATSCRQRACSSARSAERATVDRPAATAPPSETSAAVPNRRASPTSTGSSCA